MKKMLSLVVLNYNGLHHLREYFTSLFSQTLLPDEIMMFDNLSTDGSREFVAKKFPAVKIITEDRFNTGFALASNMAFSHTRGDYIVFHSNDLRLDRNCIKGLVEALESDQKVGIVTSVLIKNHKDKKTGKYLIDNAGGVIDMYGFAMQKYPERQLDSIPDKEEVFFSYGGSYIVRREVFKKAKGFDTRYFTLHEDVDLSWRIRLLGYRIIYTKKSFAYHKGSATLKVLFKRAQKRYWSERNSIRTYLKNTSSINLLKTAPFYILLLFAEICYFLFTRKYDFFLADIKAVAWNLYYLPETIHLRWQIQLNSKKNNINDLTVKKSFKLMFFKGGAGKSF